MKYFLLSLLLFLSAGCARKENSIAIAATPVPHAELLEFAQEEIEKEGVQLKIVEINEYVLPNRLLSEGQVDANFFQHRPFLEEYNSQHKTDLVPLVAVHIEPMGIYSETIKSLDELEEGSVVAIPSDPTNGARALMLLADKGLIRLGSRHHQITVQDISENPKKLKIEEIDAPFLPRTLADVDLALIPANYALQAKLNPKKDALALEAVDSPYANVVVIRSNEAHKPEFEVLRRILNSEKMRSHIIETYHGAIVPAF